MKKIILIIIVCACFTLSCNSIPRNIKNAYTYCHANTYTGIDTLINIEGYYSNSMMFYDNGLVIANNSMSLFSDMTTLFSNEIAADFETKDMKLFYNLINCGKYVICGDTIKVQMIHKSYSINDSWHGREKWYKIVDKNTIRFLDWFLITTNQKEKKLWRKNYPIPAEEGAKSTFVPMPTKPPLDHYWILKEKWFWCNEQDWKDYMEKMKQKKK